MPESSETEIDLGCPTCEGAGRLSAFLNRGEDVSKHTQGMVKCPTCTGTGRVDSGFPLRIATGVAHRNQRLAREENLFTCAQRLGISSAQLSAFENGRLLADELILRITGVN